jgi:hypothetical protein
LFANQILCSNGHISSHNESFHVILLDIKGKKTLEESLKSLVKGDILDGENKYNCRIWFFLNVVSVY